jgi:hypothetical protein
MGLSLKGYGIHGTNRPASIGRNASHGCIRLRNRDVEALFSLMAVGDAVEFVGERTPELARIFVSSAVSSAVSNTLVTQDAAATGEVAGQ